MAAPRQRDGIGRRPLAVLGPLKAFNEALDGFASAHLEVINAEGVLVHAQLHSTDVIELIDMYFAF